MKRKELKEPNERFMTINDLKIYLSRIREDCHYNGKKHYKASILFNSLSYIPKFLLVLTCGYAFEAHVSATEIALGTITISWLNDLLNFKTLSYKHRQSSDEYFRIKVLIDTALVNCGNNFKKLETEYNSIAREFHRAWSKAPLLITLFTF